MISASRQDTRIWEPDVPQAEGEQATTFLTDSSAVVTTMPGFKYLATMVGMHQFLKVLQQVSC